MEDKLFLARALTIQRWIAIKKANIFCNKTKYHSVSIKLISSLSPNKLEIKGYTKNLKQATEEIGLPGRPKIAFCLFLILANKIGLHGLISTLEKIAM